MLEFIFYILVYGSYVHTHTHTCKKQSHCRSGQGLKVFGGWGSQISRQSAHEGGTVVSPTYCPPLPLQELFLGVKAAMKNSNDIIRNRTRDLVACNTVPEPTELPRVPYIPVHTGCPRRNVPDFGRVFLMLNYTDITQNTYIQSWTVTEIMATEVWNLDSCYTLTDYQIHIKTGRNMWFL